MILPLINNNNISGDLIIPKKYDELAISLVESHKYSQYITLKISITIKIFLQHNTDTILFFDRFIRRKKKYFHLFIGGRVTGKKIYFIIFPKYIVSQEIILILNKQFNSIHQINSLIFKIMTSNYYPSLKCLLRQKDISRSNATCS